MRRYVVILVMMAWALCVMRPANAAIDDFRNFATATVSTGYDSTATTIVLSTGQGAKFPSTFPYNLVWWNSTDYGNPGADPNVEIIQVTNRVSDTLTIVRAQEGTSAVNHNTAGKTYRVHQTITKRTIDQIRTDISAAAGGSGFANTVQISGDFASTVSSSCGAQTTLVLDRVKTVSTNVSVPEACTLLRLGQGRLSITSGTVTFVRPEQIRTEEGAQVFALAGGAVAFTRPGTVYPHWWGAVGDGSTDDAPEVQAAHDSLPAAGGTIEYLGGTYKQNAEILISKSDVHIKLAPSTIIDLTNIAGTGASNVHDSATVLAGFKFTGSRQRLTGGRITGVPTVSSKHVTGALIHGASITKIGGIKIDGLFACVWAGNNALDPTLQAVDCLGNSWGVLAGYWPTTSASPQVMRLNLYGVDSHGATVGSGVRLYSYVFDTSIVGGHFYSNAAHGIDGYPGAERVALSGATLYSNTQDGVRCTYGSLSGTSAGQLGFCRRWVINGNVLYNNTGHNISIHLPDYSLNATLGGVEEVTLTGNLSQGAGGSCYYLGLVRSSVVGNVARGCTGTGFQFLSSQDLTISGNQSWDHGTGAANARAYGFFTSPTTGGTPPNNTRATVHANIGGDSRSGGSRTVNFAWDLANIDNSTVTGNIGRNANTNDWINANGKTAVSFWNNSGSCNSCQLGSSVAKHLTGSKTWDPPSMTDSSMQTTTVTVTGAVVGDRAVCNQSTLTAVMQITSHVSATDTVTVVVYNLSGGTVDMASGTLTCEVWK